MGRAYTTLTALGLLALLTLPAHAVLAPKNASDLVSLRIASDTPPCPHTVNPNEFVIGERVTGDGGAIAWSGPPTGKALVITHVRLSSGGNTPGDAVTFTLRGPQTVILIESVTSDAQGLAILDVVLPTGMTLKSGVAMCANTGNAAIHGYLANDK